MARKNKFVARREREEKQAALIRNIMIGIVVVVLLLMGYGYLDQTVFQSQKAVATVNEEKITIAQYQARVRLDRDNLIRQYMQYAQYAQFGLDVEGQLQQVEARFNDPLAIGKSSLDTIVNELIYKSEAVKLGITVSDEEVENELRSALGYFPDGTPTPAPSATPVIFETSTLSAEQLALVTITPTPTDAPTSTPAPATATPTEAAEEPTQEAIPTVVVEPPPEATATPYTLEGFQQAYEETLPLYKEMGYSEEDFRALFEVQLYFNKLYDEIAGDVPHESEYIWARHILLEDATLAAIARERLLAGEDFATVAAEASTDPSAAFNAGDLGWFTEGMMVEPFSDAAYALELGEISEPIETDFGFHIIQLLGRESRPLDATAYQRAQDVAFQKWLDATREEYSIEYFDDVWQSNTPTDPDLEQTLAELFGAQQPQ